MIEHALIMAAGRGQRMAPLTDQIPKPMAPYLDTTLIASGIERLRPNIGQIHVTVGYKAAMLAHHLVEHGVNSIFNTEGQSNSWWIHHTLMAEVDEPIVVLTCDNVTTLDFELLEEDYQRLGNPAAMLVPVEPVAGLDGDFIFREGSRVSELSRVKPSDIYCSGIQVLNPAKVCALTQDHGDFYSVWHELIEAEQLMVSSVYPENWFTVDTIEDLDRLNRIALH